VLQPSTRRARPDTAGTNATLRIACCASGCYSIKTRVGLAGQGLPGSFGVDRSQVRWEFHALVAIGKVTVHDLRTVVELVKVRFNQANEGT